jgi:hypothetical protein
MFHSGENAHAWETLKIPSLTKLARLGHFPPASQAGRLAGPVFYHVNVFSLAETPSRNSPPYRDALGLIYEGGIGQQ